MAVGTFTLYSSAVQSIASGNIKLGIDAVYMALLTSAYTPADTHTAWSDVSGSQVANGAGYNGPVATANQSCTLSGATVTYKCDPVVWNSATFTAKYAVLYDQAGAGVAASDKLVGYVDLSSGGGSVTGQGGQFSVAGDPTNGYFQFTHTP